MAFIKRLLSLSCYMQVPRDEFFLTGVGQQFGAEYFILFNKNEKMCMLGWVESICKVRSNAFSCFGQKERENNDLSDVFGTRLTFFHVKRKFRFNIC